MDRKTRDGLIELMLVAVGLGLIVLAALGLVERGWVIVGVVLVLGGMAG